MKNNTLNNIVMKIASTATALILSSSVNAALISEDLNTLSDGLITRDTTSGLRWLDLTETRGLSYNYVNSQFGSDGLYEGWRMATPAEVVGLWLNFNIDLSAGAYSYGNGIIDPNIQLATEVIGETYHPAGLNLYTGVHGWVKDNFLITAVGTYSYNNSTNNYFPLRHDTVSGYGGITDPTSGVYVVSTVPVPPAVWLFGSGLLGLIGVARRKKA